MAFAPVPSLAETRARAAAELRGGQAAAARDRLMGLGGAVKTDAESLALLASACRRLGDREGAHAAADRALSLASGNLRAVLVKADLLAEQGDRREANFYYGSALQLAERAGSSATAELSADLARARQFRERIAGEMAGVLQGALAETGYAPARSSRRFTQALDIATGKKQVYLQQPRVFFYPELPNIQFYPREAFPWLDAVESATEAMTQELNALLSEQDSFSPYLRSQANAPADPNNPLVDSLDWSTAFLWKDGAETPNAARCPRTMAALAEAPLCRIKGRSPQIMFSQLRAGAHIKPHVGVVNTRLVCHVPLITPPNCRFRVGNEVREWKTGQAWVFDDTIEHEAHNGSRSPRVVLIFDIWRPELDAEERGLVTTLLKTMDAYAPPTDWT